jgi:hypothetical protein
MKNNNKLIAKFMNVNIVTLDDIRANKDPYISSADGYTEEELKYDTSWDWLMSVIEEIWHSDIEDVTDNDISNIAESLGDAQIDGVYEAVVEFIKKIKFN